MSETIFLAEDDKESKYGAESGDLIIPGASEGQGKEKKCVSYCIVLVIIF